MKQNIQTFFKGIAMGACDVIPGVSGGTIAFITGIYDRLIDALQSINMKFIQLVLSGKRIQARKHIDASFLITLFGGIIVAILSLAKIIEFGLAEYPMIIWGFFFGLILVSSLFLLKKIPKKSTKIRMRVIIGVLIGWYITQIPLLTSSDNSLLMIGLSGMIAIIAMILPGISGSYILLILGKYQVILGTVTSLLDAIQTNNYMLFRTSVTTLIVFVIGAIIGLLLFSKVLHRIKTHYHDTMVALLTGFMLGALVKVRPRQKTLNSYIDSHGAEQAAQTQMVLPPTIESGVGGTIAIIAGILIVRTIHYIAQKTGTKTQV